MKKITILFVVLLLCSAIVLAGYTNVVDTGDEYEVTYSQVIKRGWNLLPSDPLTQWNLDDYYGSLKNVKAVYLYAPVEQKYVETKAGLHGDDYQTISASSPYLESGAAWYYFTKDTTITYTVKKNLNVKLHRGWNLLSIAPSLSVLNNEVASSNQFPVGDCEVQKAYLWDSYEQMWESIGETDSIHDSLDELADDDAVGVGIAIKVEDSCQLGISSGSSGAPPALPN